MTSIKRGVAKGTVLEERARLTAWLRMFKPIWLFIFVLLLVGAIFADSDVPALLLILWLFVSLVIAAAIGIKYLHLSFTKSEIDRSRKKETDND